MQVKQLPAQQNYAYLQAMGIKLWVPRLELPHAAPSIQCQWQTPAPSSAVHASQAPLATKLTATKANPPASTNKSAAVLASLNETSAPATQPVQEAATPTTELAPFSLQIWQLANSWQLVLTNPPNKQEMQLLHNLLFALHPQTLGIAKQTHFSWPLPNLPSKGTKQEAAFSLFAFLTGANFAGQPPEGCLIFGQPLENLLPLLTQQKSSFFYLLPSLQDLLTQPQLKAQLWQQATTNGLLANFKGSWVE